MCGIVGLFSKSTVVEERLGEHLGAMLGQMSDRGPDSAGVAVYGSRARLYAEQAQTRHTVAATVIEESTDTHVPHITSISVRATWPVGVGARTDWFRTGKAVKVGDRIDIWVDSAGLRAARPTPVSQAGMDAVDVGAAIWFGVTLGLMACVAMTRSPLKPNPPRAVGT